MRPIKTYLLLIVIFHLLISGFMGENKNRRGKIKKEEVRDIKKYKNRFSLAGKMLSNGNYKGAAREYRILMKRISEDTTLDKKNTNQFLASAYMGFGFALDFLNEDRDALKILKNAMRIDSNLEKNLMLQITIGAIYGDLGLIDKEVEYYQKAIEVDALFHPAYLNLAMALGEQGDYIKAIQVLERVIKIKPDYAKAYYQLGKGYEITKELNKSIECYFIAQRLYSKSKDEKIKNEINYRLNLLLKKSGRAS